MARRTFGHESNFNPVIEGAGDLQPSGVITEPTFSAPNFYPAVPLTFNDIATLGGGNEEYLVLSAGQFDSNSATERTYDDMTVITTTRTTPRTTHRRSAQFASQRSTRRFISPCR